MKANLPIKMPTVGPWIDDREYDFVEKQLYGIQYHKDISPDKENHHRYYLRASLKYDSFCLYQDRPFAHVFDLAEIKKELHHYLIVQIMNANKNQRYYWAPGEERKNIVTLKRSVDLNMEFGL